MSADVTTDDLHVTKAVLYLDLGQSQLLQSLFAQDQRGSKSTCKVFKLHSFKQMKSYIPVIYFYPPLPPSLVVEALLHINVHLPLASLCLRPVSRGLSQRRLLFSIG